MSKARGRSVRLSLARQMTGDFLAISQGIPLAHGERRIDIRPLRAAVAAARPRPSWAPLFFKTYAIVANSRPALRRMYVPRPWPRLYEHSENVGSFVVSRLIEGEEALFYLPIVQPEKLSLTEIETLMTLARLQPIEQIPAFRQQLRLARLPRLLRRSLYRLAMDWMPAQRACHLGTFGMAELASMGFATLTALAPWTTMVHYTPFDENGSMLVRMALDHRVIDGLEIAHVGREVEEVLNGPILEEVRRMPCAKAA